MAGERRRTVGDYVTLQRGTTYKGTLVGEPGPALLGLGSIEAGGGFRIGNYRTYGGDCPANLMLAAGDLYVALKGATKGRDMIGSIARVPREVPCGRLTQDTVKLEFRRPNSGEQQYLYWLLRTPQYRHYCAGRATGSAVVALSRDDFLAFPVPPLTASRRRVVALLESLDEKIALDRWMNQTLELMARALFKSWFVDFDPVRAKAEGRDPGLPKPLADLFPARLADSEIGEIPEGWEVGTFADIAELLRDQVNPLDSPGTLFRHFSIPAFDDGAWPKEEVGEDIRSQKSRVAPGVVLLSKLNPEIERVWLVDVKHDDQAICSTEFLVLRPRSPVGRGFTYCLARSPRFRQEVEGLVTGTSKSHQRAQAASILGLPVVLPLPPIAQAFERQADPLLTRSLRCRSESRSLAALRDTLLPKLISGELRVKDADKYAAGAV